MRHSIIYMTLAFFACNAQPDEAEILPADLLATSQERDSVSSLDFQPGNEEVYVNEYEILPADSLFDYPELQWTDITADQFRSYANASKTACLIDSSGFIAGYGITVDTECHDICVTDLMDQANGKLLRMPCTYDQGILGFLFSPSCNQFVIYSGYDSPDYDNYYEYRSEIIGFDIGPGKGLTTITPGFKYFTKDWSIEELVWISDSKLAVKVYEEGIPSAGNSFQYTYFKTSLNK